MPRKFARKELAVENMNNKEIPKEAIQASKIIEELLDSMQRIKGISCTLTYTKRTHGQYLFIREKDLRFSIVA